MDRLTFYATTIILGLAGFVLSASMTQAARIYIEPSQGTYQVGDTIPLTVRIDTEGKEINAIDLGLLYPPLVTVQGVAKGNSVIQLWVQDPSFTSSGIFFTGGVPGGITTSKGLIGKITLRAKAVGDGGLGLTPAASVLLNDGEGTKAPLSFAPAIFHIIAQAKSTPTPKLTPIPSVSSPNKISNQLTPEPTESSANSEIIDTIKPKSFSIFLGQDPRVFGGRYFISFFTTDAQSGIDHYEIQEGKGSFKIARSPYLLSDQSLHSIIHLRAYDGAGNYRESVYPGILKRFWLWITRFL